jgi:hypothetical protein
MAGKEELDIVLNADGSIKIHVKGLKGKKCLDVMKRIEKELGYVTEQRHTSEYYETETESQVHRRI